MNEALAAAAIAGITSGATTSVGKRCQQWVREVSQSVYGSAYDGFWGSSAKTTAQAFVKHGAQFVASKPYQPGDILYKTNGVNGHVGIYVGHGLVAENSTTSKGRILGAKGFRTLSQYGTVNVVVRLPAPEKAVGLVVIPGAAEIPYYMKDGSAVVKLRPIAEALGATIDTQDWPMIVVERG